MSKLINSVTTKAGVITRTTTGKAYSHAIVDKDNDFVITWAGRPDLAAKAAAQYGGIAVPVVILDKEPKDPNPGVTIIETYLPSTNPGSTYRAKIVTDTDGKKYIRDQKGVWSEISEEAAAKGSWNVCKNGEWTEEKQHPINGYLDRLFIIYKFNEWKASR